MILAYYISVVCAGLLFVAMIPFIVFFSVKLGTLGYLRGKQLFEQTNTRRLRNEDKASAREE